MELNSSSIPTLDVAKEGLYLPIFTNTGKLAKIKIDEFFESPEVDALIESASDISDYLPLAGGTMTGDITMGANADIVFDVTGSIRWDGLTSGLINFGANGELGITTDNDGYLEAWVYMTNAIMQIGFGNESIDVSAELVAIKVDSTSYASFAPTAVSIGGAGATSLTLASNGEYIFLNIETYADNAAALAGGLTAGMFYKTATGEARIVV